MDRDAYKRVWNAEGLCPIHLAVAANNTELLLTLCGDIRDLNLRTRTGFTPFMLCLQHGCFECADTLLLAGGDMFMLDNDNRCSLSILAAAIQQCADETLRCQQFGRLAQRMLSYTASFATDFFGGESSVQPVIDVLEQCVNAGKALGVITGPLPPLEEEQVFQEQEGYQDGMDSESGGAWGR